MNGEITVERYLQIPLAVRKRMEKYGEDLRWCKTAGDKEGMRHYTDISDGYLTALVDTGVISRLEMQFIIGEKR